MTDQTLIDRLQKIAALTTSSNANEAAAAAAKLADMLMKHNLSMRDIDGQMIDRRRPSTYENYELQIEQSGIKRHLLSTLARNNFCRFVYQPGSHDAWIVGEPHNVDAVLWMAHTIEPQLDRLATEGYNEYKRTAGDGRYAYVTPARTWKKDFRMGAIASIGARLTAERLHAQQVAAQTNALAVIEGEVNRAFRQFHPSTRTGRGLRASSSGYGAGQQAGSRIGLAQALGSGR